jgi:hypothetical protein
LHWSVDLLVSTLSEAVVFSAIGAGIAIVAVLVGLGSFIPALGFVLLLESTALMIMGGALDIATSGSSTLMMRQLRMLVGRTVPPVDKTPSNEERKRSQFSAAKYSLTGVLLFVEALVMAFGLY